MSVRRSVWSRFWRALGYRKCPRHGFVWCGRILYWRVTGERVCPICAAYGRVVSVD